MSLRVCVFALLNFRARITAVQGVVDARAQKGGNCSRSRFQLQFCSRFAERVECTNLEQKGRCCPANGPLLLCPSNTRFVSWT